MSAYRTAAKAVFITATIALAVVVIAFAGFLSYGYINLAATTSQLDNAHAIADESEREAKNYKTRYDTLAIKKQKLINGADSSCNFGGGSAFAACRTDEISRGYAMGEDVDRARAAYEEAQISYQADRYLAAVLADKATALERLIAVTYFVGGPAIFVFIVLMFATLLVWLRSRERPL